MITIITSANMLGALGSQGVTAYRRLRELSYRSKRNRSRLLTREIFEVAHHDYDIGLYYPRCTYREKARQEVRKLEKRSKNISQLFSGVTHFSGLGETRFSGETQFLGYSRRTLILTTSVI